jgi:putative FmdB family regulatory protein
MPIYEYRCRNDHRFEVLQKFTDEPLAICEICGAPSQRVLHPVAIHFKGSGFYSTDYGRGKAKPAADAKGDGGEKKSESASSDAGSSGQKPKAAEA